MSASDITSFTATSVDVLVDFLDGIQVEFGSKPRRDGIVSFQELEMAFRRVRRRYMRARKANKVKPVIEELLQAIEGNGMSISAWFELMDDMAINNMITQTELSKGMQILQTHSSSRKKQPVLTADQIQELFVYMDANHDGTLELNEIALACKVERYKTKSSERMKIVTSMMRALDDFMGVHLMKIRDLFVHLDKDKSDGLSRAEIRCGFHAIQAEAKRRKEAVARRKRKENLRKEAREKEARKAEAEREEIRLLVENRRRTSAAGEAAWIPAPLVTSWEDQWVGEENGILYKTARGRAPVQGMIVYFRSFKPDDGPVHGVIMHPREYFDNVTNRVTKLFNYNGEKYAGLARILLPPDGAFQGANALPGAARSNPELRYIETEAEWHDVISRQFAANSEGRLHRISRFCRDQLAILSAAQEQEPPAAVAAAAAPAKEALGEILEFVSNPDNLWALTRELLAAVVSHVRAPRSESDEAPALAASVLWKLSEYEDFVLPLLRADAVGACVTAVEDLGPPWAGPLRFWMQVAVQTRAVGVLCRVGCAESVSADLRLRVASALIAVVARPPGPLEVRKEYREGVERKTLAFASFALGHLVATSASIRGSIAHRSRLFDSLVSALQPRVATSGGTGAGGGGAGGSSPPQAVACAAFCLAHVATGESAALISRWKLLSACLTLAGLLDVCVDQLEAAASQPGGRSDGVGRGADGATLRSAPGTVPIGDTAAGGGAGGAGTKLSVAMVMESAGTAMWGCLSHLADASREEDTTSCSIRDSCQSEDSVGTLLRANGGDGGGGGGSCGDSLDGGSQASDSKGVIPASPRPAAGETGGDGFGVGGGSGGGDGVSERPAKSTREVLSTCALTMLRLLSHAAKHHADGPDRGSSSGDAGSIHASNDNDNGDDNNNTNNTTNNTTTTTTNNNNNNNNNTGIANDTKGAHPARQSGGAGASAGVPDAIVAVAGSCLSHVAEAIDLAAGPRGALESILALLLPPAGLAVREQAALTFGAIAGQGYQILADFRENGGAAASCYRPLAGEVVGDDGVGGVWSPAEGEGRREGKRLRLWRAFCTGVVGGKGAQVILDCALPGPPSRPNSLLLRERAARALSLVCLCAGPTPASSVALGGLVSLLRCREGEVVGGAATAALWALCRVPENRKTFAKKRVVSCLVPLCEWSREHDYESLHLYCLATLYLLSQEPENALQISNQQGSIAKLVTWATPACGSLEQSGILSILASAEDNAKAASCLGVIRRCLLLPEGMRALATGLASYSLLSLVLQLLRVGPWIESVVPLTLREAQGILFAVQDRAEYRGYCERICGGDPFSVEDTLALQLQRRGLRYAGLAGDAVVGLASISVTLASRRRLSVNGTVESVGRVLARGMATARGGCDERYPGGGAGRTGCGGRKGGVGDPDAVRNVVKLLKNLSCVPEAHKRLSSRPLLPLITRLWEESPDETISKLACHVLANLSRSDVLGVRNRLFQSHLAAESQGMCRENITGTVAATGGTAATSGPNEKRLSTVNLKRQQFQRPVTPGTAATVAAQATKGTHDSDDILSLSSSVFRRDDPDKGGRQGGGGGAAGAKSAATLLDEESALRNARLNAQHRLRLMPAALWGGRAKLAAAAADTTADAGEGQSPEAASMEQQQQRTFLTAGCSPGTVAGTSAAAAAAAAVAAAPTTGAAPPATCSRRRAKGSPEKRGGQEKDQTVDGVDEVSALLPAGISAMFAQAASLKRPAVTAGVPLRWQSRVVALSSLRDSYGGGATRGSPSMGRRLAKSRCRARHRRDKEQRQQSTAIPASTDAGGDGDKENDPSKQSPSEKTTANASSSTEPVSRELPPSAEGSRRRPLAPQTTTEAADNTRRGGPGREETARQTLAPAGGGGGRGSRGAGGVMSSVNGERPSTAPVHSDGRVVMRPLGRDPGGVGGGGGGGGSEPPSVVFEPGYSRLRTRRVILDRVYRFTRHQETAAAKSYPATSCPSVSGHNSCAPPEGPSSEAEANVDTTQTLRATTADGVGEGGPKGRSYPNDLQPWKPPMLFQFCKDPGKTGARSVKETIILEPTAPTTHFVFKPPAHNYVNSQGHVVVETEPAGDGRDDRIRLDRFRHVSGSVVCRGSLGHVKGMDGHYYHHYTSSDRMWYMPEHPGPYPPPAEPPSLEDLEIVPPQAEPPLSTVSGEVLLPLPDELPGIEPPNPLPLSRHYMRASMEACSRCHQGEKCPGQSLCPMFGVVPVESVVFWVEEPRLKDDFDDVGEAVVAEDGRAWSVERSSVFSQRKRQCESRAVLNTDKVKRKRFETSFGRASKLQRFPRFVAEGNRDIIIKKTSVKQEVTLVKETLWTHYNTLLSSYNYYASLDGVFGEPDSSAYQIGRDQFAIFLSDILYLREKENKTVHNELKGLFSIVNVEEESSTAAGLANLDRRLCEQEWMECMIRIGAALYRKETNNGSVARALGRFMAELATRLPKAALLDPDAYRRERLYNKGLEKILTKRIEGFRALFQTYPVNNLALKAGRRRMKVPKEELLRFSLTDWEMLVEDAGIFGCLPRDVVKMVFLQSRMLVTDELVDRTKNCCLTPVDFLEAMVRLADAMPKSGDTWPTAEEAFEVQMNGRTALNFRSFINRTGIAIIEPVPESTTAGSHAGEDGEEDAEVG